MKIAIIFFTGTGSTAKLAEVISVGFQELNHEIELIRISDRLKFPYEKLNSFDIIGIGCPTFAYRAPRIVTRWLKNINSTRKPYFLFVTSGGDPGNALWNMYKILNKKKKWILLESFDAVGPTNLRSWMPKSDYSPLSTGLSKSDLDFAKSFSYIIMKRYNEIIIEKSLEPQILHPILGYSIFTTFLSYGWQMSIATIGIKNLDKDKCTKCGLCVTYICPTKCITIKNKGEFPIFKKFHCIGCNGCVNLCPNNAIYSRITKNHHQYNIYKDYVLKGNNNFNKLV